MREKFETTMVPGWDSHKPEHESEFCRVSLKLLWELWRKATHAHEEYMDKITEQDDETYLQKYNFVENTSEQGYVRLPVNRGLAKYKPEDLGYKIVGKISLAPIFNEEVAVATDGLQIFLAPEWNTEQNNK